MIKLIAFITMFIDHTGVVFFSGDEVWRIIGRLAFPLFAWGVAMGYFYTSNPYKYMLRVLAVAVVSQIPYVLLFDNGRWNICFTLLLGLVAIHLYEKMPKNWMKLVVILVLIAIAHQLPIEYRSFGVALIVVFYLTRNNRLAMVSAASVLIALTVVMKIPLISYELSALLTLRYPMFQLYAILSLPIIFLLKERDKLRLPRWLVYGFYPGHLLFLLIMSSYFS